MKARCWVEVRFPFVWHDAKAIRHPRLGALPVSRDSKKLSPASRLTGQLIADMRSSVIFEHARDNICKWLK